MKTNRMIVWVMGLVMLCTPMMMSAKPDKIAQDISKKLAKEGWRAFPGETSLAEQLESFYLLEMEYEDDDLTPKYEIAQGLSEKCLSLGEAEQQALAMGRLNLLFKRPKEISGMMGGLQETDENVNESTAKWGDYTETSVERFTKDYQLESSRYTVRYKDEKLMESWSGSDEVAHVKIYWDAVIRNSDKDPYLSKAWCVLKMYRKTKEGYEVLVRMCNYAK